VTVAAIGLELVQKAWGGNAIDAGHFPPVFILIAVISASSMLWFMQLSSSAGASLLPTDAMKAAEPAKDAARLSEEPL
jgi:hypothetical protein